MEVIPSQSLVEHPVVEHRALPTRKWRARLLSRYGLRLRLTAWYGGALVVLIMVLALFVYWLLSTNLRRDAENQLKSRAAQIASTLNIDEGNQGETAGVNFQDMQVPGEFVLIYSNKGALLENAGVPSAAWTASHGFSRTALPSWLPATSAQGTLNTVTFPDGRWLLFAQPIQDGQQRADPMWLVVGRSLEPIYDLLGQTLYALALAGPLVVILACVGGYFLASRALAPVSAITRTARRIQAEGLGNENGRAHRIGMEGRQDELAELASTFDAMLDRLEETFKRERRFTADAAHELRSPLAVVQAETSLALCRPRRVADYERVLFIVESETARMGKLIADLLTLARADQGRYIAHENLDLTSLCLGVVERVSATAQEKGVVLSTELEQDVIVLGDATWLEQTVLNLLDNAAKYTQTGGWVRMKLSRRAQQVELSVEDNGIGISPEQLPYIFDRFYRVDESRSRDSVTPGTGLGLAICEWVARSHGGRIEVSSQLGKGSRFVLCLPAHA